jgi:hypothetical protein
MSTRSLDPVSGEVLVDVETLAREYVAALQALEDARTETDGLRKIVEALDAQLRPLIPESGVLNLGGRDVVMEPPARPVQRVSRSGSAAYAEQLLEMGGGGMEFAPPGIKWVRDNRARIIATLGPEALDRIAPEPMPGPGRLVVVERSA